MPESAPTPATVPTWRVLSQAPATGTAPTGQATRGVDVTVQLATGEQQIVFIPNSMYNTTEAVKAAIDRAVSLHLGVGALEG